MSDKTIPDFTGKIRGSLAETKQQSRTRNDRRAVSIYDKRPLIDSKMEERRLKRELKEMEL